MLGLVLDKPRTIKHLAFAFYLGHTDHITSIARDWMIALADLLRVVAVKAIDIEFRVSAPFSHKRDHGDAAATEIQRTLARSIPANSSIKTLHITGPACVVEVLAIQLHNVGGITSLSIRGRNESTFQLRDILLPNLTECSLEGLIIHGASLKEFLDRHPRLRRLTIDIRSKELLSPIFPHHVYFCPEMATTEIELPILSALTHLVISVPSALLFLRQPQSLPNLSLLELSPEAMESTPQYFWDLFATEGVFPNLEKIVIESTSLAGWIFDCGVALGEHVSMFMAIPIQSVKFLAFEGSRIDRAGHSSLDPQCLDHLSKWLPRFFPNLQTLTMHNIFIFKDARDQEDSVSCLYSMVGISPIIEIYHDKYASFMGGTVSYEQ
ncbi:hypothetical protein ONZ45_g6215 [Pleurotus djamor]|nr:hypothetical protein ONZ45_g6215 [Pleurotus djamor]